MRLACAFVVSVACLACSSSSEPSAGPASGTPDAQVDGATEAAVDVGSDAAQDTSSDAGAPGFCTSDAPVVVATGAGITATTAHYELYAELTTEKAGALARLLEASGAAFASWFERPVPTPDGGRMKVKLFADRTAWLAAMAADGISAPADSTSGYFAPSTKTAYLYEQANPYYTQVLLVHEAAHQFHRLSRLEVPSPPFWYVEGLAEYLSRHDWDGQCVRLGVTSLLSWEDLPAKAAAAAPIDVAGIVDGSTSATRAASWAIFRYLDTGPLRAKFKAYRDAFDASGSPSFASVVSDPAALSATLTTWLPTAQEPMKPIYTEWVHQGPTSVLVSTPKYFSIAMVKADTTHLEAKLELPSSGTWSGGFVVAYTDPKNYVGVVHGSDGKVRTFNVVTGSALWNDLGTAPLPTGKLEAMTLDQGAGKATVTFGGKSFTLTAPTPRAGLAANDTTARFVDISFR